MKKNTRGCQREEKKKKEEKMTARNFLSAICRNFAFRSQLLKNDHPSRPLWILEQLNHFCKILYQHQPAGTEEATSGSQKMKEVSCQVRCPPPPFPDNSTSLRSNHVQLWDQVPYKMGEFSEKLWTAFDPPAPFLGKYIAMFYKHFLSKFMTKMYD